MVGNLKFADNRPSLCSPPITANELETSYVVAASTHHPEEEELAEQWMQQTDSGLLVIVPRHIERAEKLHKVLSNLYGTALAERRSIGGRPDKTHRLYVADTLGELHDWYAGASTAFVGGSLIERGGHNVLEPFFHKIPVITGPHTDNFQDAVQWLNIQNALTEVPDAASAVKALIKYRNSGIRFEKTIQSNLLNVYTKWLNTNLDV